LCRAKDVETKQYKILHYSKFYNTISDSFEFQKFWNRNANAMAKDKKAYITVTSLQPIHFTLEFLKNKFLFVAHPREAT
jgi:hypothetical protein